MENDNHVMTRTELLTEMDGAWRDLQAVLSRAEQTDLMEGTDEAGWNPTDHLAHMAAWANSVLISVRDGKPRYEGLGIDELTHHTADIDEKNEMIRQQARDWSVDQAMSRLANVHDELVRMVEEMSDEDLQRPCSAYIPGGQAYPVIELIAGAGPRHYNKHREYIERILGAV